MTWWIPQNNKRKNKQEFIEILGRVKSYKEVNNKVDKTVNLLVYRIIYSVLSCKRT